MASTISSDEVLTHIEEQVSLVLKQRGVSPNIIAAAAMAVSDGISEVFGGQLVYFKQQRTLNSEERNLALLADLKQAIIHAANWHKNTAFLFNVFTKLSAITRKKQHEFRIKAVSNFTSGNAPRQHGAHTQLSRPRNWQHCHANRLTNTKQGAIIAPLRSITQPAVES